MNRFRRTAAIIAAALTLTIAPATTAAASTYEIDAYDTTNYTIGVVALRIPADCNRTGFTWAQPFTRGSRISSMSIYATNPRVIAHCNYLGVRSRDGRVYNRCVNKRNAGYAFGAGYSNNVATIYLRWNPNCTYLFDGLTYV